MEPLRLLVVEDSEDDARLLLEQLRRGGLKAAHERVQTADTMRAALQTREWDVVVSDYSMPGFSGIAALSLLKEVALDIPLIIVSGTISEETAVEALRAGAKDFVVKDRLARLVPAIEREVREAQGRQKRHAAERALKDTRERMQFVLEAAGIGIWESDFATGRTTWSEVLERLHGLPAGTFGGTFRAFIDRIHPDDRKNVVDNITGMTADRSDSRIEYRTTWPDGSTHWLLGLGRTIHSESGKPVRAMGVSLDNTGHRNLEEQIRQTQKLESIGGLAAGVAHDFNNLLTVIVAYSDLLSERLAGDAAARAEVDEIRRAGLSAATLTHQLLAFSRRQVLSPTVASLNEVLADSHKMLRRLVEENVRIDVQLASDLSYVKVDRGSIEQVLLNLVANARDAMPNGGVVSIHTRNLELTGNDVSTPPAVGPGRWVELSVSDNGIGMPQSVQERIFDPFFTTKDRGRGTGLGLATVHGIVKQSGGHIAVFSEVGAGTTFKLYFPVTTDAVRPAKVAVKHAPLGPGTETILVVEDAAPLRGLAERILQRHGYTVLVAGNAKEAERICAEYPGRLHVVLADVIMPGGGGRLVGEWIADRRPEARIIYMSGYSDDAIARHGLLDPKVAFLQKPFSAHELLGKIRALLS